MYVGYFKNTKVTPCRLIVHFHNSFKTLTFLYCFLPQDLFTYWDWWIHRFFWCSFVIFWNLSSVLHSTHRMCVHAQSLSHVQLLATPWTIAHQAPLSMEFSRQGDWSGLAFLLQGSSWPRDQTHGSCISWFGIFFTQGALGKYVTELQESQGVSLEWRHGSKAGGLESLEKCENIFSLEKNDQNQSFALYGQGKRAFP